MLTKEQSQHLLNENQNLKLNSSEIDNNIKI